MEGGNRKGSEWILGKRKHLGIPVAAGFITAEKYNFNIFVMLFLMFWRGSSWKETVRSAQHGKIKNKPF